MTVAELIAELSKIEDQTLNVYIRFDEYGYEPVQYLKTTTAEGRADPTGHFIELS